MPHDANGAQNWNVTPDTWGDRPPAEQADDAFEAALAELDAGLCGITDAIPRLRAARFPPVTDSVGCYDCGRPYADAGFCDLVVPNDVWDLISPTGDEGGLLCPSCMVKRAADKGLENVPASFESGPFCVDPRLVTDEMLNGLLDEFEERFVAAAETQPWFEFVRRLRALYAAALQQHPTGCYSREELLSLIAAGVVRSRDYVFQPKSGKQIAEDILHEDDAKQEKGKPWAD